MDQASAADEQLRLLQVAEAAQGIVHHIDLFLWLQGELQRSLPHEVMIAAWGDFAAGAVSFDVISPLPQLRTERMYLWDPGGSVARADGACRGVRPDGRRCGTVPFLVDLHARWRSIGGAPVALLYPDDGRAGADRGGFICPDCDNEAFALLSAMQSCLVHGFADRRGRFDCLYVFLSTQELLAPGYRRALRFLLPYIDHSLRRVTHLPIQHALPEVPEVVAVPVPDATLPQETDLFGLSQREAQIMGWVRGGKTNYEIGKILDISAFTVKNHLQRIFKKLDVSNRAQAVEKCRQPAVPAQQALTDPE